MHGIVGIVTHHNNTTIIYHMTCYTLLQFLLKIIVFQSSESIAFDDEGISTDTESLSSMSSSQPTSIQMLQLQLQEKDRRILSLESDLAKVFPRPRLADQN